MKNLIIIGCVYFGAVALSFAAPIDTNEVSGASSLPAGTRYGPYGLLDRRSNYGLGVFPEPFLVDDTEYEPGEARLDWRHTQVGNSKTDVIHPEVEMGFNKITFELETPYVINTDPNSRGFDNVDVGVRGPLYQYVSPGDLVNTTFGAALEVGIPTGSAVSKNAELVPKLFNTVEVGNFTVQSILGYSTLFGPDPDGGLQTFEYGFVFGYTFQHDEMPIPGVLQTIPVFELIGDTELNEENPGHNSLLADLGLRFNLKPIGRIQPRPGIGFIFPLDRGARQDTHWGIVTSFVFEF